MSAEWMRVASFSTGLEADIEVPSPELERARDLLDDEAP